MQLSPDSRPSRLNRGVVYWNQKKYDAALADFEAVLESPKEQRLVEAAYYRGQLYLQLGEIKKALDDFDLVVAQEPGFAPVYPLRARIHIAKGEKGGRAERYRRLFGGPSRGRKGRRRPRPARPVVAPDVRGVAGRSTGESIGPGLGGADRGGTEPVHADGGST